MFPNNIFGHHPSYCATTADGLGALLWQWPHAHIMHVQGYCLMRRAAVVQAPFSRGYVKEALPSKLCVIRSVSCLHVFSCGCSVQGSCSGDHRRCRSDTKHNAEKGHKSMLRRRHCASPSLERKLPGLKGGLGRGFLSDTEEIKHLPGCGKGDRLVSYVVARRATARFVPSCALPWSRPAQAVGTTTAVCLLSAKVSQSGPKSFSGACASGRAQRKRRGASRP